MCYTNSAQQRLRAFEDHFHPCAVHGATPGPMKPASESAKFLSGVTFLTSGYFIQVCLFMKCLLWTDIFTGLEDIAVNETAPNPCPVEFTLHHRETETKRRSKVLMFMETVRRVRRWAPCVWLRFRTIAGSTPQRRQRA